MKRNRAIALVLDELDRATSNHGPMNSPHEGFAVIHEELDELWDEVKADQSHTHRGASEAIQVAAMAIRFLLDVCDDAAADGHEDKVEAHLRSKQQKATQYEARVTRTPHIPTPDGGWATNDRAGGYSG